MCKVCIICKIEKPLSEFHKHKGRKDGYRERCKLCRSNQFKGDYELIKYEHRERSKKFRQNNKEYLREFYKNYYKKNKHQYSWRTLLYRTIKHLDITKNDHTINILGYSAQDLKDHLEKQFKEGMCWENYGEWHIDHIRPISSFDKNDDPKIINALSNLQPLWALENYIKSNKF
jgi:hypothetical protein